MGPSGTGKSTLLSLISGLEKPTAGRIELGGIDITLLHEKQAHAFRNKEIGFLFQHYELLEDFTALYNVTLPGLLAGKGRKEVRARSQSLLEAVGLGSKAETKAAVLSGGEKQRVALARAIANSPSLLICDEPTGALDEKSALEVMDLLKKESAERLVLVVTHNGELAAEYADKVFEMTDGRLSERVAGPSGKLGIRRRGRQGALAPILKRNFREDLLGNLASVAVSFLAFLTVFAGIGMEKGADDALSAKRYDYLERARATVSGKVSVPIEGSPLNLVKSHRPDKEALLEVFSRLSVSVEEDFSYFFPSYSAFATDAGTFGPYSLVPLFDLSLGDTGRDFLIEGKYPRGDDLSACLVNRLLAEQTSVAIGEEITYSQSSLYAENALSQSVDITVSFTVAGIVEEFGYLNSPKVYCSYSGLRKAMESFRLNDGFSAGNLLEAVENSPADSPYSSYRYLLFCHSREDLPGFWKTVAEIGKEEGFSADCFPLSAVASYAGIFGALLSLLPAYMAVALLCSVFVVFALGYSRYLRRKRESAVLGALGADYGTIVSPYLVEGEMPVLLGFALAYLSSMLSAGLFNSFFLDAFGLANLYVFSDSLFGVEGLLPALSSLVALAIPALGVLLASRPLRKGRIYSELKGE